jgi:hypothetical protein
METAPLFLFLIEIALPVVPEFPEQYIGTLTAASAAAG